MIKEHLVFASKLFIATIIFSSCSKNSNNVSSIPTKLSIIGQPTSTSVEEPIVTSSSEIHDVYPLPDDKNIGFNTFNFNESPPYLFSELEEKPLTTTVATINISTTTEVTNTIIKTQLEATDPLSVTLASGEKLFVEFFAFW